MEPPGWTGQEPQARPARRRGPARQLVSEFMFGGDDYYPYYSEISCGPADSRYPPVSFITFTRHVSSTIGPPCQCRHQTQTSHNSRQSVRKSTKVGKLITLDDAAERLAISKRGVRRLVSSGKLKAYRINARVIRVDSADLASVLQAVVPTGKD